MTLLALALLPLLLLQAPAPADRTPAKVMSFHGADWLERADREEEQRPAEVFRAMHLKKGDVVADLGCGTGWFARRMARVVGSQGRVYAIDIQPEMLDLLRGYLEKERTLNVEPVLGTETDMKVAPGSLDWVLMVDVYHEFQQPKPMLESIRRSLKPTGKVALIEYRLDGTTAVHIRPEHRMSVDQVMAEWPPAGFRLVKTLEFLPTQRLFIFEAAR
ncbi:MAG TPA: class I SAM-dependent methyltransferase [Vicinamibacteria bacterium]|nr:class I SAM-dependent methyltransferase [Vicinamibacteria bacterium]